MCKWHPAKNLLKNKNHFLKNFVNFKFHIQGNRPTDICDKYIWIKGVAQAPQGECCSSWRYMCIYTSTWYLDLYIDNLFFAFTFPWMKSITARLSAKFRQALPNNNRCTLYTTFQNLGLLLVLLWIRGIRIYICMCINVTVCKKNIWSTRHADVCDKHI